MMDYTKLENYTKINKFSDVELYLTNAQKGLIQDLLLELGELETKFHNFTKGIKMDESVLLMNLINLEGQSSSLIEGTQTQFEDLSYDIEGIDNVYQWETRNLLNLYKESIRRIENKTFFLDLSSVREMHIKLYNNQSGDKFKIMFNTKKVIEKIKPGKIIQNDNMPNWIGYHSPILSREENVKKASMIPIMPSKKEGYLKDLFNSLSKKYENKELLIEDIIKFHPFSDGNGRLGRLLLTLLFRMAGIGKNILINFSDVILKNKDEYISQLREVQLSNNWSNWNSYFISLLIDVKRVLKKRIKSIAILWEKYYNDPRIASYPARITILKYFFKYYKIHKNHTIKKIINKGASQTTTYRDFDLVSKLMLKKKATTLLLNQLKT